MSDNWDKYFFQSSPLFFPIEPAHSQLQCSESQWPGLDEYNQVILTRNDKIINGNGKTIRFVPQLAKADDFESQYEPLTFLKGEVQTRLNSWHDFFQVLVWSTFPKAKSTINALHYQAALQRHQRDPGNKQRTRLENFLTLFDECGSVIVYSDEKLKTFIQNFQWSDIFVEHRAAFSRQIECIVFGHAMYEKALQPYIGMTTHCLFLQQPSSFFALSTPEKTAIIDKEITTILEQTEDWTPRQLQPLPILGIPGWYAANENPDFYLNQDYFRPKRR
ncbi:MAG: DUF3025 domain-containing protein [Gammaproteobacteria bacterium]|nr:DUF3025 domain-containing protein [Gammaproteobacteria bacterium]